MVSEYIRIQTPSPYPPPKGRGQTLHVHLPIKTCYDRVKFRFVPQIPMNIQHFEKGFHYNDKQLITVARKLGKMATYCKKVKDESSVIRIDAEKRKTTKKRDEMKVAITLTLPKKILRAESRKPEVTEAIDRCIEKLTSQAKKYKELHQPKGIMQKMRRQKNKK